MLVDGGSSSFGTRNSDPPSSTVEDQPVRGRITMTQGRRGRGCKGPAGAVGRGLGVLREDGRPPWRRPVSGRHSRSSHPPGTRAGCGAAERPADVRAGISARLRGPTGRAIKLRMHPRAHAGSGVRLSSRASPRAPSGW